VKVPALSAVGALLIGVANGCSAEEKSAVCIVNVTVAESRSETVVALARQFAAVEGAEFSLVRHPGLISFGYRARRSEMIGTNSFEPGEFSVAFFGRRPDDASEASGACDRFLALALAGRFEASRSDQ